MNLEHAKKIADAVLYEGYILYPYRPSAVKNRQRWTFGGVYPRAYSEAQHGADAWFQQTQCLLVGGDAQLDVKVRFLHLLARQVGELEIPGALDSKFRLVESLRVGGKTYRTWQEAVEREVDGSNLVARSLVAQPERIEFAFPANSEIEYLRATDGSAVGVLVREQGLVHGAVELGAKSVGDGCFKITERIMNLTPLDGPAQKTRDEALLHSFVSTHSILSVRNGEFISLIDPPAEFRALATSCQNVGTYPVLVGTEGERDLMLSSPIILYDYPQVAPESAGNLFDGTEIDEILSLRILTLTDEEKQEVRETDVQACELLDRTESLPPEVWMRLHGTLRGLGPVDEWNLPGWNPEDANGEADRVELDRVRVGDVELKKGDHVRLRPKGRADAFDLLLDGHTATIESIEQDYENRIYLAVTVDDDPGRELGMAHQIGHRFFFSPAEVEPLNKG